MSAIVPLSGGAKLPAYLSNRAALAAINTDVISGGPGFPTLSIKGKVFTLVKDGERKVLTRPDDPDEVLQSVNLAVIRANNKSRVFYAKTYVEGTEGVEARPDCYSNDGVAPAADAADPQAAKCQLCPHAVWGSKTGTEGKGTACTVNTRMAVVDPDHIVGVEKVEPYLLRVPAGSRSNFAAVVKTAEARGIPYNALVVKVGFDKEAPAPKLTFKLVGLLDDTPYGLVSGLYEDETVKEIVGLGPVRERQAALPAPEQDEDDEALTAALEAKAQRDAAKAAGEQAIARAAKPAAKNLATDDDLDALLAPAETAKAKPKATPAAKAATPAKAPAEPPAPPADTESDMDDLLGGLDSLLAATDD